MQSINYVCVDVRMSFCTLTLAFYVFALWFTLSHIPPLNNFFRLAVSFKEIYCLPLRIKLFLNETLYRTSLKTRPFFSSCKCLLSKDTGNSDSQNYIDYRKYKYSRN